MPSKLLLMFNLLLFILTIIGGSIPLWFTTISNKQTNYLLAFSGSFLLSITLLHLLPETFMDLPQQAGLLILVGFFLQLLIQRLTHGVEHGHSHVPHTDNHDGHRHGRFLQSIFLGLAIHAFMEGLPLGFNYRMHATNPSLYMAVAAHKLPEAMMVTSIALATSGKKTAWLTLILFSLITPVGSLLASWMGQSYHFVSKLLLWMIPIVAGAFLHISTTIFFESGTKQHLLTRQKTFAIIVGVGLGLATLLLE